MIWRRSRWPTGSVAVAGAGDGRGMGASASAGGGGGTIGAGAAMGTPMADERSLIDHALVDQQLAQPLGPRAPGIDDAALVEADLRAGLAQGQRERAGPATEMDELQRVRDRDVLEVAGEAHRATGA